MTDFWMAVPWTKLVWRFTDETRVPAYYLG